YEFSGVENAPGVEVLLDRAQDIDAGCVRDGQMILAVRTERAAMACDRLRRGVADFSPLAELVAERAREDRGKAKTRAVGAGLRDMGRHEAAGAGRALPHRRLERR